MNCIYFQFRYTATERAQQSARYFTIGLFDTKDARDVIFAPTTKVDPILRVSDNNVLDTAPITRSQTSEILVPTEYGTLRHRSVHPDQN